MTSDNVSASTGSLAFLTSFNDTLGVFVDSNGIDTTAFAVLDKLGGTSSSNLDGTGNLLGLNANVDEVFTNSSY